MSKFNNHSSHSLQNSTRDVLSNRRPSADGGSSGGGGGGGRPSLHGSSSTSGGGGGSSSSHRPSIPALDNSPAQLRAQLEKSDSWSEFDILEVERLTDKRWGQV